MKITLNGTTKEFTPKEMTEITGLQKKLNITIEEAVDLFEHDRKVGKGEKTTHDLTAEQEKNAQKAKREPRKAGTTQNRAVDTKKEGMKTAIVEMLQTKFHAEKIEHLGASKFTFWVTGEKFTINFSKNRVEKK